jgi:hypothetical protein
MKLRGKGIFVDLFLLILNGEWGMTDYEEGRVMMRL